MDATRRCLSTGQCRVCQFVVESSNGVMVNKYEGCGITTATPICDATTAASPTGIQYDPNDYDAALNPGCVQCKKKSKIMPKSDKRIFASLIKR